MYFQGRAPKSVNMYWRRFAVASMPLDDPKAFDEWTRQRWIEKDELLEHFAQTGRFPASKSENPDTVPYIETEVRQRRPYEFLIMYLPTVVLVPIVLWTRSLFK